MLKKAILFISILSITNVMSAQSDEADALLDKIARETCECVDKKKMDYSKVDMSKLELEFGMCIMESYGRYKKKAEKLLGVSLSDDASLEKLGEDVAFKMMDNCSEVIMAIAGTYAADEYEEEKDDLSFTGSFVSINAAQFNTIVLKGSDNRTQKLLWLEYFDGEELLLNTKKLKGKRVEVVYVEKELFDPKIGEYRNFKVIKEISVL